MFEVQEQWHKILNAASETASPEARESQSFAFVGGPNSSHWPCPVTVLTATSQKQSHRNHVTDKGFRKTTTSTFWRESKHGNCKLRFSFNRQSIFNTFIYEESKPDKSTLQTSNQRNSFKRSKEHFWANRLTKSKLIPKSFFINKQFNPVRWTKGAAVICTRTCLKQFFWGCLKKGFKCHSKAQLALSQAMHGHLLGQLSAVLSAYTPPQGGFPPPFTFFHHLLKTSPSSSSLHCSLKNQAHFIPPHHIYHWSWCSKKVFSFQRCRHFSAYEKLFPS